MSKRDCGMHDGTGYCPYCGIAEANRKLYEMGVLSTAPVPDRIEEEEGISAKEAARLGYELSAERSPDVPGKEEGQEELATDYSERIWKYGPAPSPLAPVEFCRRDYLAGLREGKRLERERLTSGPAFTNDDGTVRVGAGTWREMEARLAAAQEEVAKLKEELNFRKAQIAVEEEESARLRELLQVAEDSIDRCGGEVIFAMREQQITIDGCGNEYNADRMREVQKILDGAVNTANEALARLRSGKEEGKNDA